MDEFEDLLHRYRPAGPPPELRSRIVDAGRPPSSVLEWVPAAAALVFAALFYWLAANERQMLDAYFTPLPPIEQAALDLVDLQR